MLTGEHPCYNLYQTADGRQMAVGALEQKFWDRFCEAIGKPEFRQHRLATGPTSDRVKAEISRIFRDHDQAHWIERFDAIDCCVTPVLTVEETSRNRHFRERGMLMTNQDDPDRLTGLAFPVCFDGNRFEVERKAPQLGEHNAEILQELGMTPEEIQLLQRDASI